MTAPKSNPQTECLTDREVREKLISHGVGALSDAELLGILMQEGGDGRAAAMAANALEQAGGTLSAISRMELRRLRMAGGMGLRRAVIVQAAAELGRRTAVEQAASPAVIATNDDVAAMFRPRMAALEHEEFWVLYLSSANTILDDARVSQGGVSGTAVDHKIIVKRAVELLASSVILIHNHPSGVAAPSEEDRLLTNKIITAASLFDIAVLDHLIITTGECFSFRQAGLI